MAMVRLAYLLSALIFELPKPEWNDVGALGGHTFTTCLIDTPFAQLVAVHVSCHDAGCAVSSQTRLLEGQLPGP